MMTTQSPHKGHAEMHYIGEFFRDVGIPIPTRMYVDNAKEMTGPKTKWMQIIWDADVSQTTTETHLSWQNCCKTKIKKLTLHVMARKNAPPCVWDFCCEHTCEIRCLIAHPRL